MPADKCDCEARLFCGHSHPDAAQRNAVDGTLRSTCLVDMHAMGPYKLGSRTWALLSTGRLCQLSPAGRLQQTARLGL